LTAVLNVAISNENVVILSKSISPCSKIREKLKGLTEDESNQKSIFSFILVKPTKVYFFVSCYIVNTNWIFMYAAKKYFHLVVHVHP
jgi:hypothetical protein